MTEVFGANKWFQFKCNQCMTIMSSNDTKDTEHFVIKTKACLNAKECA